MSIKVPFQIIYSAPPPSKIAKINFTDASGSYPSGLIDWNDVATSNSSRSIPLNYNDGTSSPWSLDYALDNSTGGAHFTDTFSIADFPDVIVNNEFDQTSGGTVSFEPSITGLDPTKEYTIETIHYGGSGDTSVVQVTYGGVVQTTAVISTARVLTWTNLSPDGTGKIAGALQGPGQIKIGGIIITQQ